MTKQIDYELGVIGAGNMAEADLRSPRTETANDKEEHHDICARQD